MSGGGGTGYFGSNLPAATFPLTGAESIPASTNLAAGLYPQDEAITTDQLAGFGRAVLAPVYAATITPTVQAYNNNLIEVGVLTDNIVLANPSDLVAGTRTKWDMRFTQDGTGSRLLTYGTAYKLVGGAVALSTAASSVDIVHFVSDGTAIYVTIDKAFA